MSSINLAAYRLILSQEKMEIFTWDLERDTVNFDPTANLIFSDEFSGENFSTTLLKYVHPNYRDKIWKYFQYLLESHPVHQNGEKDYMLEFLIKTLSGEYICCQMRQLIHFHAGKAYKIIGSLRNIEAHCQIQQELLNKAERDSMTGLYNKETMGILVNKILANAPKDCHALVAFDLDGFKKINDTFGHLMGDEIILDMAKKLKAVFRQDDMIARIGGDEFVVFLQFIENTNFIKERCHTLRKLLEQSFCFGNQEITVGISAGIAITSDRATTYKELFSQADYALYQAKKTGRNKECYYD